MKHRSVNKGFNYLKYLLLMQVCISFIAILALNAVCVHHYFEEKKNL